MSNILLKGKCAAGGPGGVARYAGATVGYCTAAT
jgi:hypothetical protein